MSYSIDLPNGQDFLVRVNYTQREVSGVTVSCKLVAMTLAVAESLDLKVLVIVSSISIAAVCGLLAAISVGFFFMGLLVFFSQWNGSCLLSIRGIQLTTKCSSEHT